jgi:hypothetical protein
VFKIWRTRHEVGIKRNCLEIIAAYLYRGEIEMLEDLCKKENGDVDFFITLIDEMNEFSAHISSFGVVKIWKKLAFDTVTNIMGKHAQFERILNVNNSVMEKNTGTYVEVANVQEEYYKYVLQVVFIISLKISGMYKLEMWIMLYRSLMSYKHMNALSQLELD